MSVRLTIGMPVYNGERFIHEAIHCLQNQTLQSFRLVISDNGSTDATSDICEKFAAEDSRVSFFRQKENLGATANYNFVANKADTEFFKWHSSNDLLSANSLESCVDILDSSPELVCVFPATSLFEESIADSVRYDADPIADQSEAIKRFLHIIDEMALNNIMNGVLRLDALRQTSMLREFYYADRSMMAELALRGPIIEDNRCTFFRRMDESSATQKKSEEEVLKHFDPSWKRPLSFTNWRVFSSFLSAIWRSSISLVAKLGGSLSILRRAWWNRYRLMGDLLEFARYIAHDLAQFFRK